MLKELFPDRAQSLAETLNKNRGKELNISKLLFLIE